MRQSARSATRWSSPLLVALTLLACAPKLEVPPGAQLSCEDGGSCPDGFVCKPSIGRCVPLGGTDSAAPRVAPGAVVEPATGGRDTTFHLKFQVDEPLARDPVVTLAGRPFTKERSDGVSYEYAYATSGVDVEGTTSIDLELVDLSGNIASGPSGLGITFDFTSPRLVAGTVTPAEAGPGAAIEIAFTASEKVTVSKVELVDAAGTALPREATTAAEPAENNFHYRYAPQGDEPEGVPYRFIAHVSDPAGNEASLELGTVTFDFTAPVPAETPALPTSVLRPGDVLSVLVSYAEPLAQAPGLAMMREDGRTEQLVRRELGPATFQFLYSVLPGDGDASWSLTLGAAKDAAGNVAEARELGTVRIDAVSPTIAGDEVTVPTPVFRKAGDEVVARFTTSEPVEAPLVVLHLASGTDLPLALVSATSAGSGTAYEFHRTIDATDPEETGRVSVQLRDLAGNPGGPWTAGPITIDRTPPVLSLAATPASPVGLGKNITVTVTADEPLETALLHPNDAAFVTGDAILAGTRAVWSHLVTSASPAGPQGFSVEATDRAGNVATASRGALVTIDNVPPAVSQVVLPTLPLKVGATLRVSFVASEPLAADPVVSAGGRTLAKQPDATGSWVFSRAIDSQDQEGPMVVTASAVDAAGNRADLVFGQVTCDFTPPSFQPEDVTITPKLAPAGSTVTVRVAVKEALSDTVPPTLSGQLPSGKLLAFDGPVVVGTTVTWTHAVSAGDPSGAVSLTVRASDRAGNGFTQPLAAGFTIDAAAPVPVSPGIHAVPPAGKELTPPLFGLGSTLEIVAPFDEKIAEASLTTTSGLVFTGPILDGTVVRWTRVVAPGDAEGTFDATVHVRDLAGNEADYPVPAIAALDLLPPRVLPGAVLDTRPLRAGASATVTFQVSESLEEVPVVTIGGVPMTRDASASGEVYRHTVAAGEGEGTKQVVVTVHDAAGNSSTSVLGQVSYDFTPPSFAGSDVSATPALAGIGRTLAVRVATLEAVADEPAPELVASASDGTAIGFGAPIVAGNTVTWTHVVAAGELPGVTAFDVAITLHDLAGNAASGTLTGVAKIDATAPALAGAPTLARGPFRRGAKVTATFETSEPLPDAPPVHADEVILATTGAGTSWSAEHTIDADDAEGLHPVQATLVDAAGNGSVALLGTVTYDFTPPAVVAATVSYRPASGNPLTTVAAATAGTHVLVTVVAGELLDRGVTPKLSLDCGGTLVAEGLDAVEASDVSASFDLTLPAGTPDGTCTPTIAWQDLAGNRDGHAGFAKPTIAVKTSQPVLQVDQTQVTWLRSPVGSAAEENLGAFTIPAGPYYALAPQNVLQNTATLAASAFGFASGAPTRVRLWADGAKGSLLGVVDPNADGSWPRQKLANVDVPTIYATGLDEAGNESGAVKIANGEWVATPNTPARSLNALTTTRFATATLGQDPQTTALAGAGGEKPDGTAVLARADTQWRQIVVSAENPAARSALAMAYDSRRGRVVLFGGVGGESSASVWEWDGLRWEEKRPTGAHPSPRSGHAMAYDAARGRVVLYGGMDAANSAVLYDDLWEWDGTSWTDRTPTGTTPGARNGASLAWDGARRRLVLFGGILNANDVWEWDGSAWTKVGNTGIGPVARANAAMAFDSARGKVMLFGGSTDYVTLQDLWEWDGSTWTDRTTTGTAPSTRKGHAMAYDAARARLLVFGGQCAGTFCAGGKNDLWEWDGTSWTLRTSPANPSGRTQMGLAYDSVRSRTVLFGGINPTTATASADTWEWDGTRWLSRTPNGQTPSARGGGGVTYDPLRHETFIFGGVDDPANGVIDADQWSWSGGPWRSPFVAHPSAREGTAMAFDSKRGRSVLFGGYNGSYLQDFYDWDGTTWAVRNTSGARPSVRSGHAMAYDSARDRLVLFGGYDGAVRGDTWEWDGTTWTDVTPAGPSPSARTDAAMAYDASRGRVVLFGGAYVAGAYGLGDVWEWDGASWVNRTPATAGPAASFAASLSYDSDRRRVVLFGGGIATTLRYNALWEWDGTSWTRRLPSGSAPPPRAYHLAAYDPDRQRLVVFGGINGGYATLGDHWEWDARADRQPAVQFVASTSSSAPLGDVTGLRVRANCGGSYSPYGSGDVGATLQGWANGGPAITAGQWVALATNTSGLNAAQPYLASPSTTLLDWKAAGADEAKRYFDVADQQFAFQCRPSGISGTTANDAAVALDYIEVRVRYAAP